MKQFILIGRRVEYFLRSIQKKKKSQTYCLTSAVFALFLSSPHYGIRNPSVDSSNVCVCKWGLLPVLDMALATDMGVLGNGWIACHRGQLLTGRPRSPSVQHTVRKLPALRLLCFGTVLSKVKLPEHTSCDAIAGRQVSKTPSDSVAFGVCPHWTKG